MAAGLNVYAVGRIANELRIPVQLVLRVAAELNIEPAITINDIAHFQRGDVTAIRSKLADATDEPESP